LLVKCHMKAAVIREANDVRVESVPIPKIGRKEILVKMMACGVCGTDIEKMRGEFITPPVLGHEAAGEIFAVGADVADFKVGERVLVHHHVPCHICHYCRHGSHTMCEEFQRSNIDPCGFAEYFRVPEANVDRGAVLRLPNSVPFEEATLVEPTACCIRGIMKSGIQIADDVLVIGAGPIGLIQIQLLKLFGASRVFSTDVLGFRLQAAERFGADETINPRQEGMVESIKAMTEGRGVDVVIVATGATEAILQALRSVRKGGTVNLFGAPHRGTSLSYDVSEIFIREISIIPSYSATELETNIALKLLVSGRIDLRGLVTHRFRLDRVTDAVKYAAGGKDCLKVIVIP